MKIHSKILASISSKTRATIFDLTVLSYSVFLIYYSLFTYQFAFNYEISIHNHYSLLFFTSIFFTITLIFFFLKNQIVTIGIFYFSVLFLYVSFHSTNEYLCTVTAITVLGVLLYKIRMKFLLYFFYYGNFIFLLYQLILSAIQLFNNRVAMGSLLNTGVFSIYLASTLPLLFFIAGSSKQISGSLIFIPAKIRYIIRIFCFLLMAYILFIIFYCQSRTAQISTFIIACILLYQRGYLSLQVKLKEQSKKILFIVIPIILISGSLLCYYMLSIKKMSASGRILMNKIAFKHITDYFWLGTGIGKFTWHYPQWQAIYFQKTQNPSKNSLFSAGESYIIFNDLLQLFEAVGLIGFVTLFIILFYFFKTKSTKHKELLSTIKLIIIAILGCGFTSYPLHINIVLLEMVLCLCIAFKLNENNIALTRIRAFHVLRRLSSISTKAKYICIIISIFAVLQISETYNAVNSWVKIGNEDDNRPFTEQKAAYELVYPRLKKDGKFLTDFGIFVSQDSSTTYEAISLLEQARKQFISRKTIEALGNAYWKVKDYKNAIECYTWVNNYLPSLFRPKLSLLNLYQESGDNRNAIQISNLIISMPAKIPSAEVDYIRLQAKKIREKILSK